MGEMSNHYNCILKCYFDCTLLDFIRGICSFILNCLFTLCLLRLCNRDSAIKYDTALEERKKHGKLRLLEGKGGLTMKMARVPVVLKRSQAIMWSPQASRSRECVSVRPPRVCASPGVPAACYAVPPHPNPRIGLTRNAWITFLPGENLDTPQFLKRWDPLLEAERNVQRLNGKVPGE